MLVLSILLLCYVLLIFFSKKTTASLGHFQIFKWLQLSRCIFESKYIFWVKENFAVLLAFLYDVKLVFCKIYNMLISYFHILQECFEVLKLQYFKLMYVTIVRDVFRGIWDGALLKAVNSFSQKIYLRYLDSE